MAGRLLDRGRIGAAELDSERARVNNKLRLRPKVLTASAKTGRHIARLLTEALSIAERARHRIPTPELNKFLAEITLLGQPFVKDDKQTVEKVLASRKAKLRNYKFFVVGEGIEKKSSDFAAEVMAQAGMSK